MNAVWNRALALSLLTVGAVGGMSGAAWATPSPPTPIAIVNPSFEADTVPSGSLSSEYYWFVGSFTGWAASGAAGGAGWFHPSTVSYPGGSGGSIYNAATGMPAGAQVGWANGGSSLSQTLSAAYSDNTEYQLTFYILHRADVALANYSVELLAGSNVVASISNPVTPAAGGYALYTLSYTSGFFDPWAGRPLGILFGATGSSSTEVNFDGVSLQQINNANVYVPEPTGAAPLAIGLLGMVLVVSRRQKARQAR